ncbi:MAG: matrixin family metalloprotease [Acidobacteriia bacterium]|nr:matrixin family metalloprotease [Terriglobia bacterium]
MRKLPRLIFLCAPLLALSQPVLRLKVPPDPNVPPVILPEPPATVHVIVQFQDPPSAATVIALAGRGATTVAFVPDNAVLVTMDATVSLTGLGALYAAPLSPYQKISPLIANGDPAVVRGYYLVEFHHDIDPSAARRVILNLPLLELFENPDLASRHLLVHIPDLSREAESLASLAAQDAVAYIFPASNELIQGQPVASDFPLAPGFLIASGEVLGQLVSTFGDGWDGPGRNAATLFYFFSQLTAQLPDLPVQDEILRALAEWAKVAQITWLPGTSATANRTVDIRFAQGDHGDGFPFDGPGGVLAHTFYPSLPAAEPLAGDMHFDDAESWHFGSNFDVFSVAVHEAGHALGLGSSDNPDSVMYPYYRLRTGLSEDDKTGILSLYAAQPGVAPEPLALTVDPPPATTTSATVSLSGTVTGGSGSPVVTWSSSTGASGTASVSGTNWAAASIPLAAGFNSITVTATDATGSVSSAVSVTRQIITPPPLALTVNAPPATTTAATVSLSGTVTGGSGAPVVTWSSSTGASGIASVSGTNWTALNIPLAAGFNSITVTATDATASASRVVSTTRMVSPPPVGTDTTGPTLTITYPSATSLATALSSLTFRGTASDRSGVASVTWSTNTGGAGTASGTAQWSVAIPLLVGFNQVIVRATDTAGNVSWRSVVVTRR